MIIRRFPSLVHVLCFRERIVSFGLVDFAVALSINEEERQNATLDDFEFGHLAKFFATFNGYIMNKPARYNHFWSQRRSKCSLCMIFNGLSRNTFNADAIFLPGDPYISRTTVLDNTRKGDLGRGSPSRPPGLPTRFQV